MWQPGRDKIAGLLVAGELEQVVADGDVARRLLDDAGRHLTTAATATAGGDLSGAYQLAYDAFRKSAAALLAIQGLRATSRGGHIAIQDAVGAQFGASVPAFRSFGRIRRARNSFEYPAADTPNWIVRTCCRPSWPRDASHARAGAWWQRRARQCSWQVRLVPSLACAVWRRSRPHPIPSGRSPS